MPEKNKSDSSVKVFTFINQEQMTEKKMIKSSLNRRSGKVRTGRNVSQYVTGKGTLLHRQHDRSKANQGVCGIPGILRNFRTKDGHDTFHPVPGRKQDCLQPYP